MFELFATLLLLLLMLAGVICKDLLISREALLHILMASFHIVAESELPDGGISCVSRLVLESKCGSGVVETTGAMLEATSNCCRCC